LDDGYTIVTVDQARRFLSKLINAWCPKDERPTLPVTGKWRIIKLLGATADTGETFFLPCEANSNIDTMIRLLDALQVEFGEKLYITLDTASSFTAKAVQAFVAETPIELCYLPQGSLELNPTEECGRRLDQALGNRLFHSLGEFQTAALDALDLIKRPDVFTYLCP